jgi:hypothetical protein
VALTEMELWEALSISKLGRYEIVKLALEWIELVKQSEEYKKLTQTELINKALNDIVTNVATREKIKELRRKIMKNEMKSEADTAEK